MSPQERSTKSFSELVEKNTQNHQKNGQRLLHDISVRVAKLINLIIMTIPFAIAWYSVYADKTSTVYYHTVISALLVEDNDKRRV